MKNLTLLLTLSIICAYASTVWADKVTLVTSYPSTAGYYDTLNLKLGNNENAVCAQSNSDGTIFLDAEGQLQTCKGQKSATGSTTWKVADTVSSFGGKMLIPPGAVDTVYLKQAIIREIRIEAAATTPTTPTVTDPETPVTPLSSRIVFYLNSQPQLYAGVTQSADGILSFMGPEENAANSFFTAVNSTGNVGIGNNAPAAKLDVSGTIKSSDQISAVKEILAGAGVYLGTTTTGTPSITTGSNSSLLLTGGGSSNLVAVSNNFNVNGILQVGGSTSLLGTLGIGLTDEMDTRATVEVNGKIYATTPDEEDGPNAVVTKGYLSANATACFNRFCSYDARTGSSTGSCRTPLYCPDGYTAVDNVNDDFITDNYVDDGVEMQSHVVSIACCSSTQ